MRRRLLVTTALLASSAARADVSGSVAAGAGAQGGADGYATASAHVTAQEGGDRGDRPGLVVRATGDAQLTADALVGSATTTLAWGAVGLTTGVAYQPIGDLADVFPRSGRGVTAFTMGVAMPGIGLHDRGGGELVVSSASTSFVVMTNGGFTKHFDWPLLVYTRGPWQLHFLDFGYDGFNLETSSTPTSRAGIEGYDLSIDATRVDWRPGGWHLALAGGADSLYPAAPFGWVGMANVAPAPPYSLSGRYWAELGRAAWHVGAGSWARLDPTGYAGDVGQIAEVGARGTLAGVQLAARVQGGRLHRVLVTDGAPATVAPAGTDLRMGRAEVSAAVPVSHHVELAGSAWAERSDRDDPRWLEPSTGALATHAGADLSARYTFKRGARAAR